VTISTDLRVGTADACSDQDDPQWDSAWQVYENGESDRKIKEHKPAATV
jgi:hypothetical protein